MNICVDSRSSDAEVQSMYDGDSFMQVLPDAGTTRVETPLWVRGALWGPWALVLLAVTARQLGAPSPTFFLVAAASAAAGFGAVFLTCVIRLLRGLGRGGPEQPS
jgi:hypothetical protein